MSQQELSVIIRPDGLLLEWADTTEHYPEPALHFQQELYRRYHAEPDAWLLFLSFADPHLPRRRRWLSGATWPVLCR
jgi:hypothetical protein